MNINKLKSKKFSAVLYIIACLVIISYMNGLLKKKPIEGGAKENLRMAYYMYETGVLALESDSTNNPLPTNYREPVPPLITSFLMYLHPNISQDASLNSFDDGENTKMVLQVNLFWIFFLIIGTGLLTYNLSNSKILPFLSLFLILTYFIRFGNHFNDLFTELPAATLIIWCSVFLERAFQNHSNRMYFAFGIAFGLLILTKAAFLYIFIGLILFLLILEGIRIVNTKRLLVMIAGVILTLSPWLIRNYLVFNKLELTDRAGEVLYNRVLLNTMSDSEIKGALYRWGPTLYNELVKNTSLNVNENDFLLGEKYHRLDRYTSVDNAAKIYGLPHKAISYHAKAMAVTKKLEYSFRANGDRREIARSKAHSIMKSEAIDWILKNPLRHISMSPLFAWRGIWCFPNSTIPLLEPKIQQYIHNLINLISYLSLFSFFIFGVFKKKYSFVSLTVIPVGTLIFYAIFSHNLPRYSTQFIPSMLISFSLLLYLLRIKFSHIWSKFRIDFYS